MEIAPPAALIPIFIASILGSAHCAGMCGGFVAWYSHGSERHVIPHALYSLGRLLTYLTLGVAAAWAGQSIDNASPVARLSALIIGVALIAAGISKILGWQLPIARKYSSALAPTLGKFMKRLPSIPLRLRPLLIGVVTTLLPCGWLYGFVGLAMASADVGQAVLIMTVFWAGTLPVMLTLGFFSRLLTRRLSTFVPRLTGILLVLSGLLSLALHVQHAHHPHQHHHHVSN